MATVTASYPRGVTMRPPITRVVEEPTSTHVVMPTAAASTSASVVRWTDWAGRLASVTTPTGVTAGRCASRMSRAASNCQVRPRLRGL